MTVGERLRDLHAKLGVRGGRKGFARNEAEIRSEIARLSRLKPTDELPLSAITRAAA